MSDAYPIPVYLKAEQSIYMTKPSVTVGDIGSVHCRSRALEEKILNIEIFRFDEGVDGRAYYSVLKCIELIEKAVPGCEVKNLGEPDFLIHYKCSRRTPAWLQHAKAALVCLTCFFGAGVAIMGYNNDVDLIKVMGELYRTFTGAEAEGATLMEAFYSVGLAVGIFIFFHHFPGKKVTDEPSPIQVQMRLYEQDVNRASLLSAARKGEEIDVASK